MGANDYFIYNGIKFKTGDSITCMIYDLEISDAKIYVSDKEHAFDRRTIGYICQNYKDGNLSPDSLGYRKSWAFSSYKFSFTNHYPFIIDKKNNNLIDGVTHLKKVNKECFEGIVDLAFPRR